MQKNATKGPIQAIKEGSHSINQYSSKARQIKGNGPVCRKRNEADHNYSFIP